VKKSFHQRRKELNLTLEEIGQKVGVKKSTVQKWESGQIENMKRDKIIALSKVLNVSPLEILNNNFSEMNQDINLTTIHNYSKLDEQRKKHVDTFITTQLQEQQKLIQKDKSSSDFPDYFKSDDILIAREYLAYFDTHEARFYAT